MCTPGPEAADNGVEEGKGYFLKNYFCNITPSHVPLDSE